MKLTNKQGAFVLSSFSTLRIPKVTKLRHQRRRRHSLAPSTLLFFFLYSSSSGAAAPQQSRYVLYLIRRRNKLVLFRLSIGHRRI
jgi:hypothetical protein